MTWLLEMDPDDPEFRRYYYEVLGSDEERAALDAWLESRSPKRAFALLGYEPLPKQWILHNLAPYAEGGPFDVLYGGSAGSAKSMSLLMEALAWAYRVPGIEVWLVRRTYPQLYDSFIAVLEERNFAHALGTRWNSSKHSLHLANGSILRFRHARNLADAADLLSASCQLLVLDERTTLLPIVVDKLSSRVRSADSDIPVIGIRSGSNPGDIGHSRVKEDFIDPSPLGLERIPVKMKSGRRADRFFIPAKPGDNPYLDESYYDRLSLLPLDMQIAYLEGDWSKFEGMAFPDWSPSIHVVTPEECPIDMDSVRAVGVDYGLVAPFCALWGAKAADNTIVIYRELYEVGLTPTEQAELILASEAEGERTRQHPVPVYLDPSCWIRQPNSPKPFGNEPPKGSIADEYKQAGLPVQRAYNDRIGGKRLVAAGLKVQKDGRPRLLVYSTCSNLIRTLPGLPRDKKRPEDVDTDAEDHAYDGSRYLLGGLTGKRRGKARTFGEEQRSTRASSVG